MPIAEKCNDKKKPTFSTLAAALLTQQVLTLIPCYVTKPSMCPEEKFTMTVIEPPQMQTGECQSNREKPKMIPTLAFVLFTGFTAPNGQTITVIVPGIYDENECHNLALKFNAPKHGCFEYRIATPHLDMADAVQDELQDQGVIR
jgi:hypothetical protein